MIEISHILCPIDFSEFSRHALDQAVGLARCYEARITGLHVYPGPIWPPALPGITSEPTPPAPGALDAGMRERLVQELAAFLQESAGDLPVDAVLSAGSPVDEILRHADTGAVDLVVIGTHGRSGFERLTLGSVTEKVLRRARSPVLTVPRLAARAAPVGPPLYKRILCPVDFSPASIRALSYALSLAKENDSRLAVLHVVELLPHLESLEYSHFNVMEAQRLAFERAAEGIARMMPGDARDWCDPEPLVVGGRSHQEILRVASEREVELIVMGVLGRAAIDLLLFGSTTHHVVRAATCPVLTLRSGT